MRVFENLNSVTEEAPRHHLGVAQRSDEGAVPKDPRVRRAIGVSYGLDHGTMLTQIA